MTQRLYYTDSYLAEFEATILEVQPAPPQFRVYLDRTAFYPASGGQPSDTGRIAEAAVVDVVDEGERMAHVVESDLNPGTARCRLDWARRFDHMQQHTGQHLLSAAFVETLGRPTVSFHLGPEASTIDVEAGKLDGPQIEAVESRANAVVFENRPVGARFCSHEEAASMDLRKPSDREGPIRVVEIAGYDRSACGGTHVRATGEIGPILIRRLDRVRQTVRVEFLCGRRAARRARADFDALSRVAKLFSAPLDQAPSLVAAQMEGAQSAEKARQKLEAELAVFKGRQLYASTTPDSQGRRLYQTTQPAGSLDPARMLAQQFTSAGPDAIFLLAVQQPPTLLVAVSAGLAAHAGDLIRSVAGPLGGRGGGSARLAQASFPDSEVVQQALRRLLAALG